MGRTRIPFLQMLLHAGALLPLILIALDYTRGNLTANPIEEIQKRTGRDALLLLTLSLGCTPVYNLTGIGRVLRLRRPLGLYAFMYASLHLLNFVGLDYGFNFALLRDDLSGKRYIVAGFAAFLILLALAITSTGGWIRRLGKNWQRLHWLVYAAAILAVAHYVWQLKISDRAPSVYAIILVALLLLRIPLVRRMSAKYLRPTNKR